MPQKQIKNLPHSPDVVVGPRPEHDRGYPQGRLVPKTKAPSEIPSSIEPILKKPRR